MKENRATGICQWPPREGNRHGVAPSRRCARMLGIGIPQAFSDRQRAQRQVDRGEGEGLGLTLTETYSLDRDRFAEFFGARTDDLLDEIAEFQADTPVELAAQPQVREWLVERRGARRGHTMSRRKDAEGLRVHPNAHALISSTS